ncbi:hypothetical protein [Bacillus sp. AK031]
MNEFVEKIKSFSKNLSHDLSSMVNELNCEKIPLTQAIELIKSHPHCHHSSQTLLGSVFNTYRIVVSTFSIHLETKGAKDDFILELSIFSDGKVIYSYKSYEAKSKKLKTISIPKALLNDELLQHNGLIH